MTKLLYLQDTYLFESTANILGSWENDHGQYIILDRTIFYPQWGGQPSDTGTISSEGNLFEVKMVRLDEHGVVYHYGTFVNGKFEDKETLSLTVHSERRILNARNHSAWHLIDVAMKNIWLAYMKPSKWYHFIEWPYVEYIWNPEEPLEWVLIKLQSEIDILIKRYIPMVISYETTLKSPDSKTPRYAYFEGYEGCGCGGTHVKNSGEIGKVEIRKIKMKDRAIRVCYTLV